MKAVEVRISGKRVVSAGVPKGMASISANRFSPGDGVADDGTAAVFAGALVGEDRPMVGWRVPPLADGDELTVRAVEVEAAKPADLDWSGDPLRDETS